MRSRRLAVAKRKKLAQIKRVISDVPVVPEERVVAYTPPTTEDEVKFRD